MPGKTIFQSITPATLERRVEEYFANTKKKHLVSSMTGLALHLGCTRKNLVDYIHTDEYGKILERAKLRCENVLEERMINGTPPTGIIFILKNNYGWNDKVEVEGNITHNISLASLFEQAAKKKALEGHKEEVIDGQIIETETLPGLFDDVNNHLINEKNQTEELPSELF